MSVKELSPNEFLLYINDNEKQSRIGKSSLKDYVLNYTKKDINELELLLEEVKYFEVERTAHLVVNSYPEFTKRDIKNLSPEFHDFKKIIEDMLEQENERIKYLSAGAEKVESFNNLKEYKENYYRLLENFLNKYKGTKKNHFLERQKKHYEEKIEFSKLMESAKKKDWTWYLKNAEITPAELKEIHYKEIIYFINQELTTPPEPQQATAPEPQQTKEAIKWNGSQVELVELIKALIENGSITGKQKDIIKAFENLFDLKIKYPDKIINDLKKRNEGSETLFINKLQRSLLNHLNKKIIR